MILVFLANVALTQNIPIGSWRTHFSYQSISQVVITESKIYGMGQNSLLSIDQDELSIQKLSKIDGLSGANFSCIGYSQTQKMVVIGYTDGNIDLISNDNRIFNISLIKESNLSESKKINHIFFNDNQAFLCSNFGIILVDLVKKEIKEAYNHLGTDGVSIATYQGTVFDDTIYLACEEGVIRVSLNDNIQDYNNWERFKQEDGIPEVAIKAISKLNNRIYAGVNNDGLYRFDGNSWSKIGLDGSVFHAIANHQSQLIICHNNTIVSMDLNENFKNISNSLIQFPKMAKYDNNNKLWVADSVNGVVSNIEGSYKSYIPSGPYSNKIFKLDFINQKIVGFSGGYDAQENPLQRLDGFYVFEQGAWKNYNASGGANTLAIPSAADFVSGTFESVSQKSYFASFHDGILSWDNQNVFSLIDENTTGSTLQNNGLGTQISDIVSDATGSIWIANYGVSNSIHKYNSVGDTWQAFSFENMNSSTKYPLAIKTLYNGDKWVSLSNQFGGGIWVFNEKDDTHQYITDLSNEGALPSNNVLCMSVDKMEQVWVGTDQGICYFPFAYSILSTSNINATLPTYESKVLLKGERINCIAVDGGNRKWIGTNQGAWLVDAFGTSLFHHFTSDNSPLPSDTIMTIAIEANTGEVFLGTTSGIVSYRGTATEAIDVHQQVKIFPNPVTKNFTGVVAISGLAQNATIKITNMSGKLIREINAYGGTATWNVLDLFGNRVSSGICLVFSASANGDDTFIGKVAIID